MGLPERYRPLGARSTVEQCEQARGSVCTPTEVVIGPARTVVAVMFAWSSSSMTSLSSEKDLSKGDRRTGNSGIATFG
jgi:hypothetical protein